ncbi:MAG: dUTP diphosphatase [Desulfobacteraceae bacterium]|jgi:dUTP pyrophosphatase
MTTDLIVEFKRLRPTRDTDIPLPRYMTSHAAGMDICAAVEVPMVLEPGSITLIPTGFAMALPQGFEAQIRPRSGLAVKHGITIVNAPGTIDSDYRGEVKVGLINLGRVPYTIQRGERIAQMVIQQVFQPQVRQVEALDDTERNCNGFGSTGV